MDHFKAIRRKFDDAGIRLHAYNLSFNDGFSDEEIDRGFEMAKALGVGIITASSTLSAAKRMAPFADKHKIIVAMHGHDNVKDPNQFATPESFAQAMAMSKYFWVNLDIGHFFAAGYDPVAYIREHHDRISNLHLKDRKKDHGENTPWGEGDTPIKEVLRLLKARKYDIPADIEFEYRGADPWPKSGSVSSIARTRSRSGRGPRLASPRTRSSDGVSGRGAGGAAHPGSRGPAHDRDAVRPGTGEAPGRG